MGFFNLTLAPRLQSTTRGVRFASPWSGTDNALAAITAGIFGADYAPVTRAEAMRVPAVAKARALIVGTLAHQPLNVYDGDTVVSDLPAWVQGTNTELPLWHRMSYTIDDHFFYGWSLWVKQMAGTETMAAMRVPFDMWDFDTEGYVIVKDEHGEWVRPREEDVILFPGPQEGILDLAADTIRGARAIEKTIAARAINPHAEIELKQTDGIVYESDEIDEMLDGYLASRRNYDNQVVGYTPPGIDVIHHGGEATNMLIEARNAYRLDIAAFANLPGSLLDASLSTASLTYSTQEGKRNELIDYSLSFWADPIASRLSQDDVVDPGLRVRFDMTEFVATVNTPNPPVTED